MFNHCDGTDESKYHFECSYYCNLESINNDCLLKIFKYLNIVEIVNLAATCTRLHNVAIEFLRAKAKHIIIVKDNQNVFLTAPLDKTYLSEMPLEGLESSFSYFGEFVEDLAIKSKFYLSPYYGKPTCKRMYEIVQEHCGQYLKTLRYNNFNFTIDETTALQDHIQKFQNLKELNLLGCTGITNSWLPTLRGTSKVEKLTLSATNDITRHFFEHFRNLSRLTIDFFRTTWHSVDLAKTFDLIGNCLEHLIINDKYNCVKNTVYQSMVTMINDKLPKLKSLELEAGSVAGSKLPHLKFLVIHSRELSLNINLLMQTLSDNGIIQELSIHGGFFDEEEITNAPPLTFNQLQCLRLIYPQEKCNLLKAITRSKMPVIHSFALHFIKLEESDDLLKFLSSKTTLKSIRLDFTEEIRHMQFGFLEQIIQILKEPCTPKRSFLNLQINRLYLSAEEVSSHYQEYNILLYTRFYCFR